jgi:hypothetical protein
MSSEKKDGPAPPPCYDCANDPAARLEQMFVDMVQKRRIALGQDPAMRPVFRKPHGVAAARFVIRPDLPAHLRVGVFAGTEYPVWLRSSSDAAPTDPDLTTTVGIALKLFGIAGPKLVGEGDTVDFVFQNHDVFFVDTAKDMCEFTYAGVVLGNYQPYLVRHPKTARILDEMARVEGSVLTTTYWSVLPFRFGADRHVKYKLEPETPPENVPDDAKDYLAVDMATRLRARAYRFRFLAQFQTDPATMPLDEATVRWSEVASPPVHLATLIIPAQDLEARGQASYGENLAYNIWRVPPEHAPVGSLADVRRRVYAASADTRRSDNGTSLDEPSAPRPPALTAPATAPVAVDRCIVKAAIYPGIGIARVGNSPDELFIGPEVTEPLPPVPGSHRDAAGRLKRQAARFRVYGLDAEGKIVQELTPANAQIRWTAHLANEKAAWYQFQLALDIPEADSAPPTLLRNAAVADRTQLAIDPGPRSIDAARRGSGPPERFDTGRFMGREVYLGELRTDEHGHLLVLGGHGHSASSDGSRAVTFANNDGWHDDTADGPVTAEVRYDGRLLDVTPAWVVVAPPNYAPMQKSVRTMWDLMRDVAIQAKLLPRPARPSFDRDIRPIFERLSRLQWVNAGFAAAFGWRGPFDLSTPAWLARLGQPSPADREMRHTLANQFRDLSRDAWSPIPWPWLYGDAMNVPPAETPRQNAVLTSTQLMLLAQWAAGDFDADYDPAREPPRRLDDVPVAQQGDMLDRAALEYCLADAFHPGCEMTWPVRTASMYLAAFRWKHAKAGKQPHYGAALIADTLSLPDGPLAGQYPGGITRWMAVPWQTDTASCRSGYLKAFDPYLPTFWPARVPNQVLTRENYATVMDESKPLDERLKAFANRAAWTRPIDRDTYTDTINTFVAHIDWPGIVEPRPGPTDTAHFPAELEVEDQSHQTVGEALAADQDPGERRPDHQAATGAARRSATDAVEAQLGTIEKARRFPHGLRRS